MPKKRASHVAPDNAAFRKRLRECIERVGSETELARKASIPQSTIRNYSKGVEPPRHYLNNLARAAGVSPMWLLTGEEAASASANPPKLPDDVTVDQLLFQISKTFEVPPDATALRLRWSTEIRQLASAVADARDFVPIRYLVAPSASKTVFAYYRLEELQKIVPTAAPFGELAVIILSSNDYGKTHCLRFLSDDDAVIIDTGQREFGLGFFCVKRKGQTDFKIYEFVQEVNGTRFVFQYDAAGNTGLMTASEIINEYDIIGRVLFAFQPMRGHQLQNSKFGTLSAATRNSESGE